MYRAILTILIFQSFDEVDSKVLFSFINNSQDARRRADGGNASCWYIWYIFSIFIHIADSPMNILQKESGTYIWHRKWVKARV